MEYSDILWQQLITEGKVRIVEAFLHVEDTYHNEDKQQTQK